VVLSFLINVLFGASSRCGVATPRGFLWARDDDNGGETRAREISSRPENAVVAVQGIFVRPLGLYVETAAAYNTTITFYSNAYAALHFQRLRFPCI